MYLFNCNRLYFSPRITNEKDDCIDDIFSGRVLYPHTVSFFRISLKVDGKAKEFTFNEDIQANWKMYFGGLPPNVKIDGVTTYSLNGNIKNIFCGSRYVKLHSSRVWSVINTCWQEFDSHHRTCYGLAVVLHCYIDSTKEYIRHFKAVRELFI